MKTRLLRQQHQLQRNQDPRLHLVGDTTDSLASLIDGLRLLYKQLIVVPVAETF